MKRAMASCIAVTDEARAELVALERKHRGLTRQLVVEASKDPQSALHELFAWDDDETMAELGRLELARFLIMSVKVTKRQAEELHCSVTVRQFYGMGEGDGYRSLDTILASDMLRARLLERALSELRAFEQRYSMLSELAGVFRAAAKVKGKSKPPVTNGKATA